VSELLVKDNYSPENILLYPYLYPGADAESGLGRIRPAAHFIVVAVPFSIAQNTLKLELQASDGLQRWRSNFDSVIVAAPTADEAFLARNPGIAWVVAEEDPSVQYVPLPMAFRVKEFARHYRKVRALLAECIDNAQYLQFGIGALVGDWGAVAAEIAIRKRRRYAIHMDRVEHELVLKNSRDLALHRRLKARVVSPLMLRLHRRLIERAALALFNGQDTMDAYGNFTTASRLVYDLHIDVDASSIDELSTRKQHEIRSGTPLRICYTGRFDHEKAPLDWIGAIAHAQSQGAKLSATWLGDGPLRMQAIALVNQLGCSDLITLPGFVSERQKVMNLIESSHLMLFTHIGRESPRCLLEALIHSTTIVGYDSTYSKELVSRHGGGLHVKSGDFEALGAVLVKLDRDRWLLADLIARARMDGRRFGASEVFRARSELIIKYLGRLIRYFLGCARTAIHGCLILRKRKLP
jgi:glycosyltransferase involved in cell wall biosynthesis